MPCQHPVLVVAQRPLLEDLEEIVRAFLQDLVGLPGRDLVRTRQVLHVREDVAHQNGPHDAQAQGHIDFQAAALFGRLVELVLRQQEEAEILQAHAVEGHLIGFVVLAEAAGAAGAGRQEDVVVQRLLLPVDGHFVLQEIHQAARGKDRGAARAGVDQFLAGVQVRARDIGQRLGVVIQIVEDALDQPLVLPGQAAEQNRGLLPLFPCEGPRFIGSVVSNRGRHEFPPCSLRLFLDLTKARDPQLLRKMSCDSLRMFGVNSRNGNWAGLCPWVDTNP